MAKKEQPERESSNEDLALQRPKIRSGARRGGFRAGDALLIVLAVTVTALMIFLGAKVIPSIRASFSSYDESITFTVEYPILLTDTLPQAGDAWVLLDSDGAICTVREVEYSDTDGVCCVTLLRKNAIFREGEGYLIENIRISVGSTLYFRGVSDRYFAVTVLSMSSDRFPIMTEESTAPETDGALDAVPEAAEPDGNEEETNE